MLGLSGPLEGALRPIHSGAPSNISSNSSSTDNSTGSSHDHSHDMHGNILPSGPEMETATEAPLDHG